MLGAIIGDIVGSRFEWHNIKTKEFELFHRRCRPTDDSVMTLAVAQAILDSEGDPASLSQAIAMADAVTKVTHDHPEGMKGAEATAAAIFLARSGKSMAEIRAHIVQNYYPLDFTLDEIRPTYTFDVSCQGSVPQALEAFFESESFEDAIRNAISIGGDSDTIAAITGGVAEAFYGVPEEIRDMALSYLDDTEMEILIAFSERYGR